MNVLFFGGLSECTVHSQINRSPCTASSETPGAPDQLHQDNKKTTALQEVEEVRSSGIQGLAGQGQVETTEACQSHDAVWEWCCSTRAHRQTQIHREFFLMVR
jgi:hypothetical protein